MVKIPILLAKVSFYLSERSSVVRTFHCRASALSKVYGMLFGRLVMSCLKPMPCRKGTDTRTREPAKHVPKATFGHGAPHFLMEKLSDNGQGWCLKIQRLCNKADKRW